MNKLDFLPDSINENLKMAIYGLLLFHSLIFIVWICLMIPTLNKAET